MPSRAANPKAIMIAGPLGESDLAELLAKMREIEQRNPTGHYQAMILDLKDEMSIGEMEAMLRRIIRQHRVWHRRLCRHSAATNPSPDHHGR